MVNEAYDRLKGLILADKILATPGVHVSLSARIAASGVLLGEPDSSQLSLRELANHCARVCDAVDLPVFADGGTGFGNPTNVVRAVREFEKAGVAGLFIEDQVFPKRCGHTPDKDVFSSTLPIAKPAAAVRPRYEPQLALGIPDASSAWSAMTMPN
ncbi:MAG: isocitrate lyase/PEP mutase family protein [Alphaproteobacteria bacterium]|jgi:methylisocitrate lyase|nr:hypothetical protein [Rhodospirillaceae bacterium]MAG98235.1 hypothetical protein [Rhodospirillaceae bacterium]MDP6406825.1 isocitrate lyase/PEP mutase family protein [Alphaproteobacteria bacterium]MDP6621671.1 isocitrate lyase/PEP mutase family protein [Alphaproteobacteria bacterium]|tara:strand:- start:1693 stop:2160 length:468 start_codon:yes stop_codon:yes gene_type:complete